MKNSTILIFIVIIIIILSIFAYYDIRDAAIVASILCLTGIFLGINTIFNEDNFKL